MGARAGLDDGALAAVLRMPAEWAPHERTLIAWPGSASAWRGATLAQARDVYVRIVAAIAAFEPVTVVADPADADEARRRLPAEAVEVVALPLDDAWLRDCGPVVVTGVGGSGVTRLGIDFRFNGRGEAVASYDDDAALAARLLERLGIERFASPLVLEGGAIAVDGAGRLVTTEQCLLARNPLLSAREIERELRIHLGVDRVVWLSRGLVEDVERDGHVDGVCAFVAPGRVVLQTVGDPADRDHLIAQDSASRLRHAGIEVERLDLLPRFRGPGRRVVAVPYVSFYLCNGAAIVPLGEQDPDMDAEALRRLAGLLPGRELVGVPGRMLALAGGGVHSVALQVPATAS